MIGEKGSAPGSALYKKLIAGESANGYNAKIEKCL